MDWRDAYIENLELVTSTLKAVMNCWKSSGVGLSMEICFLVPISSLKTLIKAAMSPATIKKPRSVHPTEPAVLP